MDDQSEDVSLEPQPSADQSPARPTVYIADTALAEMNAHAAAEPDHEIGGIMIGSVIAGNCPVVRVEAVIRGTKMTYTRGSVTFTHDTWSEINRIKDEQYPDERIVGWYHSHPGFGLFLSGHDLFIHRNFFTAPYQVAFVTDPRAGTFGCFTWQNGDLAQDHGFRVSTVPQGYPTGPAPAEPPEPSEPAPARPAPPAGFVPEPLAGFVPEPRVPARDPGMMAALWLLTGFVAVLLALSLSNFAALSRLPQQFSSLDSRLNRLGQDLEALRTRPAAGSTAVDTAPSPAVGPADGATTGEAPEQTGAAPAVPEAPTPQEGGQSSAQPRPAAP